jgi:hypothetical protein
MLCRSFLEKSSQKEKSAQKEKCSKEKLEETKTRKKKSYNKKGQPLFFIKKIEADEGCGET